MARPYATVVFDRDLMRPGCALLQAFGGCGPEGENPAHLFPTETWLLAPTPGMRVYRLDSATELEALVRMVTGT